MLDAADRFAAPPLVFATEAVGAAASVRLLFLDTGAAVVAATVAAAAADEEAGTVAFEERGMATEYNEVWEGQLCDEPSELSNTFLHFTATLSSAHAAGSCQHRGT